MQTGYYASAAGMVAQFNRLDVVANNLANVNTAGFKADDLVVDDFMRLLKEARDELPHANHTKEGAKFLNRVLTKSPQIVDEFTNFAVGSMQKTDNSFDFALDKEGLFFLVKTPDGVRLTRDGSFRLNDEGTLVTKEGYEVLPENYFDAQETITFDATQPVVKSDNHGQFFVNIPNSIQMVPAAKLFIFQADNPALLKKEGSGLFSYEDSMLSESIAQSGAVKQGYIEKSNVNAVKMMTQLIETNRLVGMYQKAMDSQMNDMNRDAIEKIARKG